MRERITNAQLEYLCERINNALGTPQKPYERINGKLVAQVGNHHISGAYGGVCLHRMCNESGGVTTPLSHGHIPKRDLYNQMRSYLAGLEQNEHR